MTLSLLLGQEQAGGLHDVLSAHLGPRQISGVLLSEDGDLLAVDDDGGLGAADLGGALAVHGVVLQHVGQILSGAQVIDADDLDLRVVQAGAENHAADTAKTVNTNFNAHKITSSRYKNIN